MSTDSNSPSSSTSNPADDANTLAQISSDDAAAESGKHGEYVVVARRYRPQAFGELIGQQHVAQALCNAIETNRIGHAYLFTGARGVGKTSAARIMAKALNCVTGTTANPCGNCDVCTSVATGGDVDVLEIDGASNRGIDEIRQLRSNISVRPSRSRFKIYIIDEVHMLTKEAFNALLKTLEEPPDHVKFIFCTTDPEKMPITVLSRCQRFDFAPVESNAIVTRLQQIVTAEGATAEPEALMMLARRAAGSMRDSQSLLEQLLSFAGDSITADYVHKMFGTAQSGRVSALVDQLLARDAAAALAEVDAAVHEGVDIGQLAEQLVGHVRDMMAACVGCEGELMLHNSPSDVEVLREKGTVWGLQTMLAALQILDQVVARMRQSIHRRVLVEMAIVRIANLSDLQQLSDLIAQTANGSPPVRKSQPPTPPRADSSPAFKPAAKKNEIASISPPAPRRIRQAATATHQAIPLPDECPEASPAQDSVDSPSHNQTKTDDLPAKNVGATVDQTAASAAGGSDSPEAKPQIAAEMDFESVDPKTLWKEATKSTEGVISEVASEVQSVTRSANKLQIVFPTAYGSSFCQRPERHAELEKAVSQLVGKTIRLEFSHEVLATTKKRDRPAAVSMRDLVRKSSELPMVKRAMDLFDAEVTRVQPPKKEK